MMSTSIHKINIKTWINKYDYNHKLLLFVVGVTSCTTSSTNKLTQSDLSSVTDVTHSHCHPSLIIRHSSSVTHHPSLTSLIHNHLVHKEAFQQLIQRRNLQNFSNLNRLQKSLRSSDISLSINRLY